MGPNEHFVPTIRVSAAESLNRKSAPKKWGSSPRQRAVPAGTRSAGRVSSVMTATSARKAHDVNQAAPPRRGLSPHVTDKPRFPRTRFRDEGSGGRLRPLYTDL